MTVARVVEMKRFDREMNEQCFVRVVISGAATYLVAVAENGLDVFDRLTGSGNAVPGVDGPRSPADGEAYLAALRTTFDGSRFWADGPSDVDLTAALAGHSRREYAQVPTDG